MAAIYSENRKTEVIDLTKVIDENLSIYAERGYSDPLFQMETWCTVPSQGYKVSRISLGTQTGTHIDAPAHFSINGATLEALPVDALIGKYLWLNLDTLVNDEENQFGYRNETLLFLTSKDTVEISQQIFDALLKLPCRVWVIVYGIRIAWQDKFHFNSALAEAGKYLVEDMDEAAAQHVRPGGEIIALPLRLKSVSGSPCRVVVRQPAAQDW
jgi:arylformamidase